MIIRKFFAVVTSLGTALSFAPVGLASVSPDMVEIMLHPGETHEVTKEVTTPALPPTVDVCLLEDETGSFADDIDNLQAGTTAEDIYNTVVDGTDDAQFAVAGFRDYPEEPFGLSGDHVYRLLSSMDPTLAAWEAGIAALSAFGGNDLPEAQYDAIVAAAGPGTFDDPTLEEPQDNCGWRDASEGAQRVLVVATDAEFHLPGADKPHVNDEASTVAALNAQNITVVGLKAPGAGTELDALAAATGGNVQPLSSDGSDIGQAILDGLAEVTTDVWHEVSCDEGLNVSLTPDVHEDVPGDTTVLFDEVIEVPTTTLPGEYHCEITFLSGDFDTPEEGTEIGVQEVWVEVVPIEVSADIRPQSCPNPLSTRDQGVIPAAIPGTADLDVADIDPTTVTLEGVSALHWDMEDVTTPYEGGLSDPAERDECTDEGPDGLTDLTLKFDSQDVLEALGSVEKGDVLVLTLSGQLLDGTSFEGVDVVWIR